MIKKMTAEAMYRLGLIGGFRQVAQRAPLGPKRGSLIFMFHRFASAPSPLWPADAVDAFDWLCGFLNQHYQVLSLSELEARRQAGTDAGCVALTFDDGYRDNYLLAYPVLKRHGITATIFLTSGALDGLPLWTSRLSWICDRGRTVRGEYAGVEVDLSDDASRLASWTRLDQALKRAGAVSREEALARLSHDAGVADYEGLDDEMLSWDQVREMHRDGIDFGGHTTSHPILADVDANALADELIQPKQRIEEELGAEITTFAYPNGTSIDYGPREVRAVRDAGYSMAYTTIYGANTRTTHPLEQRRVTAYGATHALIALQIERFFYATR